MSVSDKINSTIIHKIDDTIDNGPIIFRKDEIFPSECKTPRDYRSLFVYNLLKCMKFYRFCDGGKKFNIKHQPEFIGRYNPKLNTKINGFINWDNSSEAVYRLICAFDEPYEGAKTNLKQV